MRNLILTILLYQFFMLVVINAQQDGNWLNSGDISLQQTNIQNALSNYNNHIENNPNDPIGYIQRARLYGTLGRTTESNLDMQVAERLNPLSMMYVNTTMRSKYLAKKSYEYNYEDLNQAFTKTPSIHLKYKAIFENLSAGHAHDSLILAVIQELNNKNIDRAEFLLSNIDVTDLNRALVYDLSGKIHLNRMDYEKAITLFSKAIEADTLFSIAYHNRSLCYKLMEDYDKAEEDLKAAIEINENVSLFYFTFAKLNESKGNDDAALDNYSKAIELDADYEEALVNYSQILKGLGEYETGLMYLNKAINKNPDIIENKFYKANLHFVYGKYDNAIKEYNNYLREHPNDSDALFNVGLSMILMRNKEEGCNEISNSLEIEDSEKRRNLYNMFCNDFNN